MVIREEGHDGWNNKKQNTVQAYVSHTNVR